MKHNGSKFGMRMLCAALALVIAGLIVITGCISIYPAVDPGESTLPTEEMQTEQSAVTTPGADDPDSGSSASMPTVAPYIEPTGESGGEQGAEPVVPQTAAPTVTPENPVTNASTTKLSRISSIDASDFKSFELCKGGILYQANNNKYGVMSLNGSKDTGAVYSDADDEEGYFTVTSNAVGLSRSDANTFNRYALIDGNGRAVTAEEYAAFEIKGRFAVAYKATSIRPNNQSYLFYVYKGGNSFYFDGEWAVYDTVTGQKLNVSGKKNKYFLACGDYLKYQADDNSYVIIDAGGSRQNADMELLGNGTYLVKDPGAAYVYNSDGSLRFRYDPTQYSLDYSANSNPEGYYAQRRGASGYEYALVDNAGNLITGWYDRLPARLGNMILVNGRLYKLDGSAVIDTEGVQLYREDAIFGRAFAFKDDTRYYVVDTNGKVLRKFKLDSENVKLEVTPNGFIVTSDESGTKKAFNFKTKQYDIDFYYYAGSWLVKARNAGGTYDLIDTFTGEMLLSGYSDYDVFNNGNGGLYLYATLGKQHDFFQIV